MNKPEINKEIQMLYGSIAALISQAKTRVATTVNAEGDRAPYGKQIIVDLSDLLSENFGSGWSQNN